MLITGIILSGGQSTRMGTDKAFIQIEGKTLLENAIEICRPFCSNILISSNRAEHGKFGHKVIPDEIENCGPLGGIYSCLNQTETDWNFIISVDAAFVEPDFVSFIISETADFDTVVPFHKNGKEPLVAMYHKKALFEIKKMLDSGDFKMHNLLNSVRTKYVDSQDWVERFPKLFRNLNRPADL